MMYFEYGNREINHLRGKDKRLASAIDEIGLIRREIIPDLFTALINSIVGQQISNKAADTVWNRLCILIRGDDAPVQQLIAGRRNCPLVLITPKSIADLPVGDIQQCGMSHRKASYIKGAAQAVLDGRLDIDGLKNLPDEDVIKKLMSLHGVGLWTAEMLLIFSMQRPDIVSWNDLAIRRGMARLYSHKELTKERFERYKKRYSPYGSVASLYLWEISK